MHAHSTPYRAPMWKRFALPWVVLSMVAFPALPASDSPVLVGVVQRVIDADTIDVQLESGLIRVRLNAIDAPERNQPGGKEATAYLSQRILNQRVELEPFSQDRYERLVAEVFVGETNINMELVAQGHAWAFRRYMKRTTDTDLCTAEERARRENRGLWARPKAERIAPWEYRNRKERKTFTDFSRETAADCVAAIGKRGN